MRRPDKSIKLYQQLRDAILCRQIPGGMLLPGEKELALKFKVSRGTLRTALARLEENFLIRRIQGDGTYVGSSRVREKITYLLPCAESVRPSSDFVLDVFRGVLKAVQEYDNEIEIIPVSPTNHPDDIDFARLLSLNRDSKVVFIGFWFGKIFQFLKNTGCRVAIIHENTPEKKVYESYLSEWCSYEMDKYDSIRMLTEQLLASGVATPIFFSQYIEADSRRYQGYREAMAGKREPLTVKLPASPDGVSCRAMFKEALDKYEFDGFITDCPKIWRAALAWGWDKPCGCQDFCQFGLQEIPERGFYSDYQLENIGYQAVVALTQKDYSPKKILLSPMLQSNFRNNSVQKIR